MYSENSNIVMCLDSFSKQIYNIWVIFRLISVFETTALLNLPIYRIFLWLLLPDLIGSLMIPYSSNLGMTHLLLFLRIFVALKRSKLFCSYLLSLQLVLCRVVAVKSLPTLIFSADYILLLVL